MDDIFEAFCGDFDILDQSRMKVTRNVNKGMKLGSKEWDSEMCLQGFSTR